MIKPTLQQIVDKIEWAYEKILSATDKGDSVVGVTKREIAERMIILFEYDERFKTVDRGLIRRMAAWKLYV